MAEIEGREHIERAMARGQGVIFLTAHFKSIEIRKRLVERTIHRSDVRSMVRTLRQGKGIWFAPDQIFAGKDCRMLNSARAGTIQLAAPALQETPRG